MTAPVEIGDRRARRREETIEEILDIAEAVMRDEGVTGLSLSEVARRLGVRPPSLYKYFPSLNAVYDALFERGQREHCTMLQAAMEAAQPGLDALVTGLEATGRWGLEHQAMAQLMFWRPVPGFEPSEAALAPSHAELALRKGALAEAVRRGELGPGADSDEALYLAITLIAGVFVTAVSNEPDLPWGEGRFTPRLAQLVQVLPTVYPPAKKSRSRS
ncbi:MAG: TetR/AcrR family transcriptional regulator [Sporichthyaceae bacterium]